MGEREKERERKRERVREREREEGGGRCDDLMKDAVLRAYSGTPCRNSNRRASSLYGAGLVLSD